MGDYVFNIAKEVFEDWETVYFRGLRKSIKELGGKCEYILKGRFGEGRTLQAIGDDLGITRERVRQIEEWCLDKLKEQKARHSLQAISLQEHEEKLKKKAEELQERYRASAKWLRDYIIAKGIDVRNLSRDIIMLGNIEELDLGVRARTCLHRMGIKTIYALYNTPLSKIAKERAVGEKTIKEIKNAMLAIGLKMPEFDKKLPTYYEMKKERRNG